MSRYEEKTYHVVLLGEIIARTNNKQIAIQKAKKAAKEANSRVGVEERVTQWTVDQFGNERGELT